MLTSKYFYQYHRSGYNCIFAYIVFFNDCVCVRFADARIIIEVMHFVIAYWENDY